MIQPWYHEQIVDLALDSVARVKGIKHFFIMSGKDFLKDFHMISMRQMHEMKFA